MKSSQRFELPIYVFVVGIANIMLIIFKLQNITLNKHLPWDALGNN